MELDFDKYCVVDGSPTTVLPAPRRRSQVSSRKSNGKVKCGNDLLSLQKEFNEIKFSRYRSASCKDVPSIRIVEEGHESLKRGSVYQSSKEVSLLRRNDGVVQRKKIEFARGSASRFSVGIIDSLCSLDEESPLADRDVSSVMPPSEESTSSSSCKSQEKLHYRNSINQYSFDPIPERRSASRKTSSSCKSKKQVGSNHSRDLMSSSVSTVDKMNDNKSFQERDDAVGNLQKSLSAKLALPHSPARSDSDCSKASSPRGHLHPVLKMFDPFVKSKSHKSPLNCAKETGSKAVDENIGVNGNKTVCRSLLTDLSDKPHYVGNSPQFEKKDDHDSVPPSSPAHLHALLKMERKNGMLSFEFSVKSPEDVYVAKTCKVDNPLSWGYTFHCLHHRRKSNASAWGFKENNKESSLVGQMLVSCYLCTELKGAGSFNDSMVTEFVLYNVSHSRRSISSQESAGCSPDLTKPPLTSNEKLSWGDGEKNETSVAKTNNKAQSKHSRDSGHYESCQPLTAVELHPGLETAAIIMQVPCEKRESLKFKSGDRQMEKPFLNLLDLCQLEQKHDEAASPGKLHVVIPAGNHSLPSIQSRGPSPLLDRWRLGGGCDCGGWDMSCPLNICNNPNLQIAEGQPLIDTNHPAQLFIQGRKYNVAAFTMRGMEDGKYAVDFHAQLSSLQAFSIGVAILHAAEASTAAGQERSEQMLQSDSLRVFAEEEIKHLIDAISEEEKLKANKVEDGLPSFVLNPPFSPISRA